MRMMESDDKHNDIETLSDAHRCIIKSEDNTDPNQSNGDNETSDNNTSDSPVFGNVDPDADPDPEPDTPEQIELPCECESYDPAEAPDRPFTIKCTTCGKIYRVRE